MAMSPEVQREYDRALRSALIDRAQVIEVRPSTYGWADYEATEHIRRCGGYSTEAVEEDAWREFVDSWNGDKEEHGLRLAGVNCSCGRLVNRNMRWTADRAEIAEAVFAVALGYQA